MSVRKVFNLGTIMFLLASGSAWAQQPPSGSSSQNPSAQPPRAQEPATPANPVTTGDPSVAPSSPSGKTTASSEKAKHWTGSLVDANCMAKTLGSEPAKGSPGDSRKDTGATPTPSAPHFTPESPDQLQQAGQSGGATPIGAAGRNNPSGTPPTYPGQDSGQNPDMSQAQAARMAAADKFDMAAKQCAASASTQQFALALESGEVVRFDNNGDAKATEALRTVDVQTGKKIKAKVTGIMEANNTVRVVSVEVKAKKSKTSSMAGEQ